MQRSYSDTTQRNLDAMLKYERRELQLVNAQHQLQTLYCIGSSVVKAHVT